MENEKMQVNFAPGVTEATLRVIELHEENELPVLEPDDEQLLLIRKLAPDIAIIEQ